MSSIREDVRGIATSQVYYYVFFDTKNVPMSRFPYQNILLCWLTPNLKFLASSLQNVNISSRVLAQKCREWFFFREGFWGEICLFEPCCEESRRLIRTRGAGGRFACTPKSKRILNHRKMVQDKNILLIKIIIITKWFVKELKSWILKKHRIDKMSKK